MSTDSQILAGIRVIDAATYIAAPSCAAVLSDFGAEVIKIERPPLGDPFRGLYLAPSMPDSEYNYPFMVDNRNKRSIALNLAEAAGYEVFQKLVRGTDILITNYQPQMQKRFRLRYEDVEPLNPRLIFAMVTGYGESGEEAEKPGYDMTAYFARSGLMSYIHGADAEPYVSPCGFGDHPTSMSLFGGIMLALYRRVQTGKGSKVWTTLMHNGVWSNASMVQSGLCGSEPIHKWTRKAPADPLVNHYVAGDGKRLIFCLLDAARDWKKLCAALDRKDLAEDPRYSTPEARKANHVAVVEILDAELAKQPLEEWTRRFATHDVLFGIVPHTQDVANDSQMAQNGVFVPIAGAADPTMRTISSPVHLDGVEKRDARMPPGIGQHSEEILAELGYSPDQVAALKAQGVVTQS